MLAFSCADLDVKKLLTLVKSQPKFKNLYIEGVNLLKNGMTRLELGQLVEEDTYQ
ncbi:uncharacterized protein MYCFIDRAFT_181895 [Pseudocercospora fijiensis CIRAD86]|uniref:Uncharacterized protein n=1 Tax=Pseudocercospora fijiensis (strain CIRAD86) TaxID=383855 RepID=M3BAD1_PSEFD|nr:uncharacterized protein MYCFIDRAFT_181895 [Pseudocercospora fijiensis CIRAD86]EME86208.1 hypothetical protein MYCFIDRAFT_181895 [Pseudocercospora fijiensis CIRAD86]